MRSNVEHKLTAIFYLLIRDHLPAGDVIKLVNDVRGLSDFQFTNEPLFSLARELVSRLEYDPKVN